MEGFLFKNQSSSRCPPNIAIPVLGASSNLCPVSTLKLYFDRTNSDKAQKIFLNPNASSLAFWMCKAMKFLLPDAICKAHDTRKLSHSLAWSRGVPIDEIVKKGFWASQNTFIKRYLVPRNSPSGSCVVAGHRV